PGKGVPNAPTVNKPTPRNGVVQLVDDDRCTDTSTYQVNPLEFGCNRVLNSTFNPTRFHMQIGTANWNEIIQIKNFEHRFLELLIANHCDITTVFSNALDEGVESGAGGQVISNHIPFKWRDVDPLLDH